MGGAYLVVAQTSVRPSAPHRGPEIEPERPAMLVVAAGEKSQIGLT